MGMFGGTFHHFSPVSAATKINHPTMRHTMNKKLELPFYKETQRTFVYKTKDEDSLITSLYLMKSQMPAEAPKKITVTVDFK